MKQKYRIGKVLSLAGLIFLANACHKDPTPEPNPTPDQNDTTADNPPFNPEDTVTPWRKIVIDWDWDAIIGWAPPKDTIKYYTDQKNVGNVKINIIGLQGPGFPVNCTNYRPSAFHKARDTLQTRIDIDSLKVGLSGTIWAHDANATNHNPGQPYGVTPYDMEWFRKHGCTFKFSEKRNAFFIRRHR
ncbi:MAG: hypothetical protein J6T57_01955 [Alphaproteobacteria bacterium]|nr:hypothetical protein [Alphaproteobacteria bacterium]